MPRVWTYKVRVCPKCATVPVLCEHYPNWYWCGRCPRYFPPSQAFVSRELDYADNKLIAQRIYDPATGELIS